MAVAAAAWRPAAARVNEGSGLSWLCSADWAVTAQIGQTVGAISHPCNQSQLQLQWVGASDDQSGGRSWAERALGAWRSFCDAAGRGDCDALLSLLERGADVNGRNNGCTALHTAAVGGYTDAVTLLARFCGADVDAVVAPSGGAHAANTFHGMTALQIAAASGHTAVAAALADAGASLYHPARPELSALVVAAWCGHTGVVQELLQRTPPPDCAFTGPPADPALRAGGALEPRKLVQLPQTGRAKVLWQRAQRQALGQAGPSFAPRTQLELHWRLCVQAAVVRGVAAVLELLIAHAGAAAAVADAAGRARRAMGRGARADGPRRGVRGQRRGGGRSHGSRRRVPRRRPGRAAAARRRPA